MRVKVDVNCDLGESYGHFKVGNDAEVMPYITSANIACGFHAGDPTTMANTVALAKKHGVAVGAHPSYPDLMGFGRREIQLTPKEAENIVIYQIGALEAFAKAAGTTLQHVKPHGAFYNMATENATLAAAIVKAVKQLNPELILFAPPKSKIWEIAGKHGLRVAVEAFADRAYTREGRLVPRTQHGAVIENPETAARRAVKMVTEGIVESVDGVVVRLGVVHTICVHGDTPQAVEFAKRLNMGLKEAEVEVKPVSTFI